VRPGDILCLELDKDVKGEAEVLFLSKVVYIAKVDKRIKEWVCRLISGNIPNDYYKAIPQRGNTVHIISCKSELRVKNTHSCRSSIRRMRLTSKGVQGVGDWVRRKEKYEKSPGGHTRLFLLAPSAEEVGGFTEHRLPSLQPHI